MRHWHWEASGRNGTWFVDKYDLDEDSRGTYGSVHVSRKREATTIAAELNNAFASGRIYEREQTNR